MLSGLLVCLQMLDPLKDLWRGRQWLDATALALPVLVLRMKLLRAQTLLGNFF